METPQKRRGLFSRITARAVAAPLRLLAGLLLALSLALWPAAVHAISQTDLSNITLDQATQRFGSDVNRDHYVILPSDPIPNPGSVQAKDTGLIICFQSASSCNRGSPGRNEGVEFRLSKVNHLDRGGGTDSWDFVYSPVIGGHPVNTQLAFVYRSNTGSSSIGAPDSWGIVVGDPGNSEDVSQNRVAGLESFGDSDLANKVLDAHANTDGVQWAKAGGATFSESHSAFADRALQDPFMQAVSKAAEAINSLNETVSKALLWAVQTSNPNSVRGLGEAWQTVRDLVNVLFIIILAAVALMTIARIDAQRYNVRSLLPMLIFAVITVNFSFVVATVLADSAYVLSQPFLDSALNIIKHAGQVGGGAGATADSFGTAIVMLLAALLMLVALVILLFFFIIRIIVIWLLSALSPVVCLFMVLPLTRGEGTKLLQTAIRWIYMAPIAFLILYIGSRVTFPNPGQDQATDSLLAALFYGGLIVAAVIIPIGLGGQVMRMAAGRGSKAAKLGGKGGLGAIGLLPSGGGKTVGQRARTARAFMKQRGDSQEAQAQIDAAQGRIALAESLNQMGGGGQALARSITGATSGQQVAALEAIVGQAQKEMIPLGLDSKMRIANAYKYGTGRGSDGQMYARTFNPETDGLELMKSAPMDAKELALANNRINAAAAFRELAQAEFVDPHLLEGSRNFAWTGYQQLHKADPVVSSFQRSGNRINEKSLEMKSKLMSSDDMRGLDGNVMRGAMNVNDPHHREYLRVVRNIGATRWADAVDPTARNKFFSEEKQALAYKMAQNGVFSRGLTGDAYNVQREKEKRMITHAERGLASHQAGPLVPK